MNSTRIFLSIGMAGALLFPGVTLALDSETDASAAIPISAADNLRNTDFLNTFIAPTGTAGDLGATFDVQALTAHPCYSAVGAEQEYCLELFGVTSDFSSMIDDRSLDRLIIQEVLDRRCRGLTGGDELACRTRNNALLPDLLLQLELNGTGSVLSDTDDDAIIDDDDEPEDEETTLQEDRRMRMTRLWELCEDHELPQAGCYQNFLGTINRATLDEIEELFGMTNEDAEETEEIEDAEDTEAEMMNDQQDETDVRSETTDEDGAQDATRDERAEWLWDLCADSTEGRAICYRDNYRAAVMEQTDLTQLEGEIRND